MISLRDHHKKKIKIKNQKKIKFIYLETIFVNFPKKLFVFSF